VFTLYNRPIRVSLFWMIRQYLTNQNALAAKKKPLNTLNYKIWSWNSIAGTVTDLREENPGFDSQQRQMSRSALRPNWSASPTLPRILSLAVEWPEVRLRLTTHLLLLPRLRMSGSIPPFP